MTAASLADRLNDALPQTQCTRCGYPDCRAYAEAIAHDGAAINRCPPGGAEGIVRLALVTGRAALPLDPGCGVETRRTLAVIDEDWCIGCTLCIKACPVDCIVGAAKVMHTVIAAQCTGCELCLPVCPVDCIALQPASGDATGWQAWSAPQADAARSRHALRQQRLQRDAAEDAHRHKADARRAAADAALQRARARRALPMANQAAAPFAAEPDAVAPADEV